MLRWSAANLVIIGVQYMIFIILANPSASYYPNDNLSTLASPFTGPKLNQSSSSFHSVSSSSAVDASLFPFSRSQISGTEASTRNFALPSKTVAPYPYASKTPSKGPNFPDSYGSLPTPSDSPSSGRAPYPTTAGFTPSRRSSLHAVTGGYYAAGNASTSDIVSTVYLTGSIAQTVPASCTINAVSAQIYYWDKIKFNVTQCDRFFSDVCTNQSTVAPYTLGAPATRTVHGYYPSPARVTVWSSFFTSTITVPGPTNPTYTKTNTILDGVSYTKVTYIEVALSHGYTRTAQFADFSYTTPPVTAPSDVLRPDIKTHGYTYGFTAIYPTPNVLYSIFEIESVQTRIGLSLSKVTSTSTFTAPVPYIEAYTGHLAGSGSVPNATGLINPEAPGYLASEGAGEVLSCAVGTFHGTPTVEVVLATIMTTPSQIFRLLPPYTHVSILGPLTPTKTTPHPLITVAPTQIAPLIGPIPIEGQSSSAAGTTDGGLSSNPAPKGEPGSFYGHGVSQGVSGQGSSQGNSQRGSQSSPQDNNKNPGKGGSSEESSQTGSQGGAQSRPQDGNQSESDQGGTGQGSSGSEDSQGNSQSGSQRIPQGKGRGGSGQKGSGQGSSSQGGFSQGGSSNEGPSRVGPSPESSDQPGSGQKSSSSGGVLGKSGSGQEGSSHQVVPGGHQTVSPESESSYAPAKGSASTPQGTSGQRSSSSDSAQGDQSGLSQGIGTNGEQGSGGAPSSFETTVGKLPISVLSNAAVISGETFAVPKGSPAITTTIKNQPVVINPSQVIAGGRTISLPGAPASTPVGPPSITFGGSVITANPSSQFIVAGQTLSPGSEIEVSGTKLSLGPHAASIVIGSSTISLNQQPVVTLAPGSRSFVFSGNTFTVNPTSPLVMNGQTLSPGGAAITISGTRLSLAPSASEVVVGGATLPLKSNAGPITGAPAVTMGGQKITPNPAGQYIVSGQTLIPGGPAITLSGTRISLATSASQLVIGSSTVPLSGYSLRTLTIGGQTIVPNAAGQYIVGGQTLSPGGSAITVSGTRISLGVSASDLVVGSSTLPLSAGTGQVTAFPALTIGHQTVTANKQGQYVVGGQTLTAGGVITVSGTRMSLAPSDSEVVIGTSTESLGGAIMGGFKPNSTATAAATDSLVGFEGVGMKASLIMKEWWTLATGVLVWIFM